MADANKDVRRYIESDVRQNAEQACRDREIATGVINQVQQAIPHAGNVQHTGSNYEGNVTKNSSDFDAMLSIAPKDAKFQAEHVKGKPGFTKLKYIGGADQGYVDKYITDAGYLSGKAVVQKQVAPAVDRLIGVQNKGGHLDVGGTRVETRRSVHGPAVTIDWEGGRTSGQVDIVASVERSNVVGGKNVDYVPKPSKKSSSDQGIEWRQSYSRQEKEMFRGADAGDVLKTGKTVRANDSSLQNMPSYVQKTAAMSLIDKDEQRVSQGAAPKEWASTHTADRVRDLGKELYQGLDRGDLRIPANRAVNVLEGTSEQQREQWKHAIGPDGDKFLKKASGNP